MLKNRWFIAILAFSLIVVMGVVVRLRHSPGINAEKINLANAYLFPDVTGPSGKTVVEPKVPTPLAKYAQGLPSRLALLITEPDSSWLGLAHGLKAIGVPFEVTQDYRQALTHRVVLVYPKMSPTVLAGDALQALVAFARQGGTLIAYDIQGGDLNAVFGFDASMPTRQHYKLTLANTSALTAAFTDPRELVMLLGRKERGPRSMGSFTYTHPHSAPLGVYEDGAAAITRQSYGKGTVYAIGVDPGFLALKGYNNREEGATGSYVNGFEPTIDVMLHLLRNIYVQAEPDAVTLGTVPFNRTLSVIITHDIDYTRSVKNAVDYAEYERDQGISATYFMQTKYIRDYNDDVFFNAATVPLLNRLTALGMEIGSHTVCHSRVFNKFPLGQGDEQYPFYKPYVVNAEKTDDGTILGEVRVSKFLLERLTDQHQVVSFRPGDLSNPYALPQALAATGYRFSSSVTANDSLTHLPFQLNYGRDTRAETDIFEFPLTLEDEALPRMDERLPQALELARRISKYGGCFVVLIHPDVLDYKFEFEKGFIQGVKGFAWFGTIAQMGEWWSARNKVELDVMGKNRERTVQLEIPDQIQGLTLNVPADWRLEKSEPKKIEIVRSTRQLMLKEARGEVKLFFRL